AIAHYDVGSSRCTLGDNEAHNDGYDGECGGFFKANVSYREFKGTQGTHWMAGALFQGAQMDRTNFYALSLVGANFFDSSGKLTNFQEARLTSATFQEAHLIRPNFYAADALGAQFYHSSFVRPNFQGANLFRAKANQVRWLGANLYESKVDMVSFYGSDLRGSNLQFASCADVDLRSTQLQGASLGCDGENLETLLRAGHLQGAKFDDKTIMPWSRATAESYGMIYKPGMDVSTLPALTEADQMERFDGPLLPVDMGLGHGHGHAARAN
ncbi:MAG TPA: pentapeptide repeat-containing protein, partial [Bdellovibrionota bacterium]|nr:pentapeptide repeat-containing protein [Bdellovibrionota bacterium]